MKCFFLAIFSFFTFSCGIDDVSSLNLRGASLRSKDFRHQEPMNDSLDGEKAISYLFDDYRHFYGIAWRGAPEDNLRYARQTGYQYVFYQSEMEKSPLSKGMKFFIESPELNYVPFATELDLTKAYSKPEIDTFESFACWKSDAAFPKNIATGWPRNDHQFTINLDFQQQKVIDYVVELAIKRVKEIEAAGDQFSFAGIAWDEANYHGEFWSHAHSRAGIQPSLHNVTVLLGKKIAEAIESGSLDNFKDLSPEKVFAIIKKSIETGNWDSVEEFIYHPIIGPVVAQAIPLINSKSSFHIPISYWTGNDSCVPHTGITHEYDTYTEGLSAYYKKIMEEAKKLNPSAKSIMEPYQLYLYWVSGLDAIENPTDFVPDFLSQESRGTQFVDDERIFDGGFFDKAMVGSSSPNTFTEEHNRETAGKAAINGSWYNWYGRFGGSTENGGIPNYQSITEVPARLKLVRLVPNWDNLANISLTERTFDDGIYKSPNSMISPDVIYTRLPGGKKIYVVFLTTDGRISLNDGEAVSSVKLANEFFEETINAETDLSIVSDIIKVAPATKLGVTYIINLL